MPLYEVTEEGLERRPPAAFAAYGMYERADLQRLLRDDISALDEDLLVIAEEFGNCPSRHRVPVPELRGALPRRAAMRRLQHLVPSSWPRRALSVLR